MEAESVVTSAAVVISEVVATSEVAELGVAMSEEVLLAESSAV